MTLYINKNDTLVMTYLSVYNETDKNFHNMQNPVPMQVKAQSYFHSQNYNPYSIWSWHVQHS